MSLLGQVLHLRHSEQPKEPFQDDDVWHLHPTPHIPPVAMGYVPLFPHCIYVTTCAGTITNPQYMTTKAGSALLVDGWYAAPAHSVVICHLAACLSPRLLCVTLAARYGFARKPHYLADWVMATCWGLACGFDSPLP
jgi:hypothetical protein